MSATFGIEGQFARPFRAWWLRVISSRGDVALAPGYYRTPHSGLARLWRAQAVSLPQKLGKSQFHQFLSTAKGSCAELRSQLYVALDVGYLDRSGFDGLLGQSEEVACLLGALRAAVGKRRDQQRGKP
ncbi:four helix bundle protein [Candidatus Sumerlaeota bacterium]|nr:four helix bundle protein [Candidatus Sumerlaeota bacterium]